MSGNLYHQLHAAFEEAGDGVAFDVPGGVRTTYRELIHRVARMSAALKSLGIGPGDRVMAQIEKSLGGVTLYLATLKVGAIYNPLNTAYTPAELAYFIADSEPGLLVIDGGRVGEARSVAGNGRVREIHTLCPDGSGSLADLAKTKPPDFAIAEVAPGDTASLVYTSGTTGRSKGAMITHDNLLSNARALLDIWGFSAGDVLLHALPIFHVHGLYVALNTAFLNRSRIIWLTRFEIDTILDGLKQATVMMGVPTFYTRLLAAERFGSELCANMRLFISGSAPLLAETHHAFEARSGHRILERYGMTETGMIASNPLSRDGRIAGTVGYALPGVDVRLRSEAGAALPAGEVGVLEVKGPNVFAGYWRKPDLTAGEFRDEGYFITGDLATMAADGRVTIVGRAKDLIICGGYNIYPKEIEKEIDALPGIGESAVIGVPHPDLGEAVVAAVTASGDGAFPGEAAIIGRIAPRLARFKLPRRVFEIAELPRNAMGKVQKSELRARFSATFEER